MRDTAKCQQILTTITNYNIQDGLLYIKSNHIFIYKPTILIDKTLERNQCEEILTILSQQSKINELHISDLDNENFYEAL
jgi:hypothetical protein